MIRPRASMRSVRSCSRDCSLPTADLSLHSSPPSRDLGTVGPRTSYWVLNRPIRLSRLCWIEQWRSAPNTAAQQTLPRGALSPLMRGRTGGDGGSSRRLTSAIDWRYADSSSKRSSRRAPGRRSVACTLACSATCRPPSRASVVAGSSPAPCVRLSRWCGALLHRRCRGRTGSRGRSVGSHQARRVGCYRSERRDDHASSRDRTDPPAVVPARAWLTVSRGDRIRKARAGPCGDHDPGVLLPRASGGSG